jgi:hypothetical protein
MNYNNRRETFPGSVYAGMFNFAPAALLESAVISEIFRREAQEQAEGFN